ncbi:MAG: Putrescine transport system permease protein PotH, partial [uncultured Nocardioidaceae bacterium]
DPPRIGAVDRGDPARDRHHDPPTRPSGLAAAGPRDALAGAVLPLPDGPALLHLALRPRGLLHLGLPDDLGVPELPRRGRGHLEPVRPLLRLRRHRHGSVPDPRLPTGLRHRLQGRPLEERDAGAGDRPLLHQLLAAHLVVGSDPVRPGTGDPVPADHRDPSGRRSTARHAGRGHRRSHLQLPAVHDAAAVRVAGQGRLPADRGGRGPLLQPGHRLPERDVPAVPARGRLGHAADVHPRQRRLHQRRAARHPQAVHDRQPDPGGVHHREGLPARGQPVDHLDGDRAGDGDLLRPPGRDGEAGL